MLSEDPNEVDVARFDHFFLVAAISQPQKIVYGGLCCHNFSLSVLRHAGNGVWETQTFGLYRTQQFLSQA